MRATESGGLLLLAFVLAGCTVYRNDGPTPADDRVFVCHDGTRTLNLPDAEVRAHLDHGDRLGRCG